MSSSHGPLLPSMSSVTTARVITLIDMDCFYVQVEQRDALRNQGKLLTPAAVVQYNSWKGGGIIAVDYAARAKGVTRNMRGDEATRKCPEIHLFQVPCLAGKADLTKYRDAGAEVIEVLCQFSDCVERASVDEAYVDLSQEVKQQEAEYATWSVSQFTDLLGPQTHISSVEDLPAFVSRLLNLRQQYEDPATNSCDKENSSHADCDWWPEWRLLVGACLVQKIRAAVESQTGFQCSAGVAHNKILAKLACGLHKPNKQTLLPQTGVMDVFLDTPLKKVRGLGGKFGDELTERMGITTMGQLLRFSESDLQKVFGESQGSWLYDLSRGHDTDPVKARKLALSIGCSKHFHGKLALTTEAEVSHWVRTMCEEVSGRLRHDALHNHRKARLLTVGIRYESSANGTGGPWWRSGISQSRCTALVSYDVACMQAAALNLLREFNHAKDKSLWSPTVYSISVGASKFVSHSSQMKPSTNGNIKLMFQSAATDSSSETKLIPDDEDEKDESKSEKGDVIVLDESPQISPVKKKAKTQSSTPLERFLEQGCSSSLVVQVTQREGTEQCAECLSWIPLEEFPEHCDFHVAQRLQKEWNRGDPKPTSDGSASRRRNSATAANTTKPTSSHAPASGKINNTNTAGTSLLQFFKKL